MAEQRVVHLPEMDLDGSARDLLQRLLQADPTKRLKSLRMLRHIAFYKGYDFEEVKEKKVGVIGNFV